MRNLTLICLSLSVMTFSCGKKSSKKNDPASTTSPTETSTEPDSTEPKTTPLTDAERCLQSGGRWDSAASDCSIPQAKLPLLWASFKELFPSQFKANVTGNNLSPYIWLYTVPEVGKNYTCKDWMVRIGYSRQLDNEETETFISTDCTLAIINVTPAVACIEGKRAVDIDFQVSGSASLIEKNGGKSTYRISDSDLTHRIVAAEDCE